MDPGAQLGHYEIQEPLGKGGMGEVYRARDTSLDRDVAIKVLPAELAGDEERRLRFEREAKAVAALDHPNIVVVHSIDEAESEGDAVHFLTMQLVEGRTLDEVIPADGLPLGKFFDIAIPLVDAVAAAHERGIVHRDLKPSNVMLADDGRVRILDFGLAKLREGPGLVEAETQAAADRLTGEGQIVGTVAYMSPEQAEGKQVDHRSDIFSLGILLYQMATGKPPFEGDTQVSIISSIVKETPDSLTSLRPAMPRHLGRIVKLCLAKEPEKRIQTARGLRNQLQELREEIDSGELSVGEPTDDDRAAREPGLATVLSRRTLTLTLVAGIAAILIAAGVAYHVGVPLGRSSEGVTTPLAAGAELERLTMHPGAETYPNLTPDGDWLVYAGTEGGDWDVYLRSVGSAEAINLTADSPARDTQPALSPDGRRIAFRSDRDGGGVFLMDRMGASVRRLTDFGYHPDWSPDGTEIVVDTEDYPSPRGRMGRSELWVVDVDTGERRRITEGDAVQPAWSPDGARIAYWSLPAETGQRDIRTISPDGTDPVAVTDDEHLDWSPAWSPDGRHLFFSSDRSGTMSLWRVAIDELSGRTRGEPEPVTTGGAGQQYHLSVASGGREIAYVDGETRNHIHRVALDLSGHMDARRAEQVTRGSFSVFFLDVSPGGDRLAFTTFGEREDLYLVHADGAGMRQLTDDPALDRGPRWSPDGERIAFYSNRSGSYEVWTIRTDGSDLRQVTESPKVSWNFPVWAPDGSRMAVTTLSEPETEATEGSYILDLDTPLAEREPEPFPPPAEGQHFIAWSWSPEGEWVAGHRRSGTEGVALYSTETGEYRRISDFGWFPTWLHDGERLLFPTLDGDLKLADVPTGEIRDVMSLGTGKPTSASLAISPDDETLYFLRNRTETDIWLLELAGAK